MALRGRGTPLPLCAAREFVTTGPYRHVRNPMAVAGIAQGVAVGVFFDSSLVVLYALAGAVLWHTAIRPPEERDLLARFPAAFPAYRDEVPLWVPRLVSPRVERLLGTALLLAAATLAAAWTSAAAERPTGLPSPAVAAALALAALVLLRRRPCPPAAYGAHSPPP
jgi:hypothetical protein